ncbi:MAG: Flp pilus assembly complex ATPase component TadA [Candidatus Riflebacteria bacterium]|nr:Flp pilus assembly complex ATPase component TadA [Candidatus Riflebacteria bacterium]
MLLKVCQLVKVKGASDMHLYPDRPVYYRVNGAIQTLDSLTVAEEHIKKIILETSSPKAREILGKFRQVTYAADIETVGRLRFSVFFDRGRFAMSVRFISDKIYSFQELGFSEAIKKILAQHAGLILVGSSSGEGKTSTIASIINFYNSYFEKNIITIENPVEYLFKDNKSAIIQRSIPLDISNFYAGLCEMGRVNPDVVVSDSLNYPDAMDKALSLCESGTTVIGGTEGGDCLQILERIINLRSPSEREVLRSKLASQLTMIISQRLVPKTDHTGRKAIFDIMVNTPQLRSLIRNNNFTMFRTLQSQGEIAGMKTFDSQLAELLRTGYITKKAAAEFSIDKKRFGN